MGWVLCFSLRTESALKCPHFAIEQWPVTKTPQMYLWPRKRSVVSLRLQEYRDRVDALQTPAGTLVVDVQQAPDFASASADGCVPCLIRNSCLYSFKLQRHMTKEEHLCAQGLHATEAACTHFELPWRSALEKLKPAEVRSLAGNGMHCHVVSLVLAYALANTKLNEAMPALPKYSDLRKAPSVQFEDDTM